MENWNKIEFIACFKLHISPKDLEQLEYYRIHYILKEYEEYIKEEQKEAEKQEREAEKKSKGTSFGNFNIPKFEVPKFQPPKF